MSDVSGQQENLREAATHSATGTSADAVTMRRAAVSTRRTGRSSLFLDAMHRLFRNKLAIAGMVIMGVFILTAIFAPLLSPYDPLQQELMMRRRPPSQEHWFGRDDLGRDILSRVIYGARLSLQVGVLSVGFAIVIGALIGAVASFAGGWVDSIVMRLMDIMLAFPALLLAIAIVTILGPGLLNMLYAIGIVSIPAYARTMRASVLAVKEQDYILAARSVGVPPLRMLLRNVVPNCLTPIIVEGTLGIGTAILDAAGLSFLGLGAQPPEPEWGAMLGQGRYSMFTAPHIVLFPGLAIMLTVLGFNLLGDGLRDALDPRLRT